MKVITSENRIRPKDKRRANPVDVEDKKFGQLYADGSDDDDEDEDDEYFLGLGKKAKEKKLKKLLAQGLSPEEAASKVGGKGKIGKFLNKVVGNPSAGDLVSKARGIKTAVDNAKSVNTAPPVTATTTDAYMPPSGMEVRPWYKKPVIVVPAILGIGLLAFVAYKKFSK